MEPSFLRTYQPSAANILREPSRVPLRLAAPRQSRTVAGVLSPVVATKVLRSTGPVTPRDATQVSRFVSSRRATWVQPSRQYRRPSTNNPTNAAFLAGTLFAGREVQNADNHAPTGR